MSKTLGVEEARVDRADSVDSAAQIHRREDNSTRCTVMREQSRVFAVRSTSVHAGHPLGLAEM